MGYALKEEEAFIYDLNGGVLQGEEALFPEMDGLRKEVEAFSWEADENSYVDQISL